MRNFLLFVLILASLSVADDKNKFRTDKITEIEVLDASSGNDTVTLDEVRAIWADSAGILKFKQKPQFGTSSGNRTGIQVMEIPAGQWIPMSLDIIYQYYTGTTAITCKTFKDDGTSVPGIKVGK